jgi:hypothetical protein
MSAFALRVGTLNAAALGNPSEHGRHEGKKFLQPIRRGDHQNDAHPGRTKVLLKLQVSIDRQQRLEALSDHEP